MPVERCMLCGGRLNGNRICTECGMDNKKNDRHYRHPETMSRTRGTDSPGGRTEGAEPGALQPEDGETAGKAAAVFPGKLFFLLCF